MSLSTIKAVSTLKAAAAAAVVLSMASCDSIIYEDLPLCSPTYKVRLKYDRNMRYADEVQKVQAAEVYAFDADGALITSSSASLSDLKANNWTLPLDLPQGKPHRVIAWAGLTDDAPFTLDATRAVNTVDDLTCRLNTTLDADGNPISKSRLTDLFHADQTMTFSAEDGTEEQSLSLTKNNNDLRIILRKSNGASISHADYDFFVEEDNAVMGPDNKVVRGEKLWYHPVDRDGFETAIPDGHGGLTSIKVPAAVADMHLARLTPDSKGRVIVKRTSDGAELISYDLMPLILAAKEFEAPSMDDQEYLDREDNFTIHLVLDEDEIWLSTEIYVNGWVIVLQSIEW
ncbi:MAG: FimB/Mfa2 family fimbrial subunit [Bacteroides sp.]|nr:FimB/Mfa2 family fimbrial subunit [Bacteroides sp.]